MMEGSLRNVLILTALAAMLPSCSASVEHSIDLSPRSEMVAFDTKTEGEAAACGVAIEEGQACLISRSLRLMEAVRDRPQDPLWLK